MSYPAFADFDKTVNDTFNDDFDLKNTIKVKSAGPFNTTLTTTSNIDCKTHTLSSKLALKWAHKSGFALEKFEIDASGKHAVETSLKNAFPGLTLEFKGNDSDKGDVSFAYKHKLATFTGEFDGVNFSRAVASLNTGYAAFTAGAVAQFGLSKFNVQSVNVDVGVGYTLPQAFVGVRANKKFSEFQGTFLYSGLKNVTVAGKVDYAAGKPTMGLATVYSCNPKTTIKVKANCSGTINASVKQTIDDSFSVTGAVEVPMGFKDFKFGVSANLA